jgi:hypothetical protein
MKLRLDIGVNQIIGLIKQLPFDIKLLLKNEIDKEIKSKSKIVNKNEITDLLLYGPVMSDEEYKNYRSFRKDFNKWTKKIFV